MNESKYLALSVYEKILMTAYKHDWARCNRDEFNTIVNIFYENEAEKFISKSAYNCSKCKLKAIKRIAEKYFNYVDIKNLKNNE